MVSVMVSIAFLTSFALTSLSVAHFRFVMVFISHHTRLCICGRCSCAVLTRFASVVMLLPVLGACALVLLSRARLAVSRSSCCLALILLSHARLAVSRSSCCLALVLLSRARLAVSRSSCCLALVLLFVLHSSRRSLSLVLIVLGAHCPCF